MSSQKLDLAFAMDCTGSMGSYIASAKENIRKICEEIVASEQADVQLALVEYRDHPPQENSFVTRVNDFTPAISRMKSWLELCSAQGGGDEPEAVADAMHELLKLSWREGSARLAVLVSDAPPHGIGAPSDTMPNGCPLGHDPMTIAHQLAKNDITLYVIGVEPSVLRYKDFFMVLAHAAGGRYVPLSNAQVLAKAIIASAQEEISLAAAMAQVRLEVEQVAAPALGGPGSAGASDPGSMMVDEEAMTRRVHDILVTRGVTTKQMVFGEGQAAPPEATVKHIELSRYTDLGAVRAEYAKSFGADFSHAPHHAFGRSSMMAFGLPPPPPVAPRPPVAPSAMFGRACAEVDMMDDCPVYSESSAPSPPPMLLPKTMFSSAAPAFGFGAFGPAAAPTGALGAASYSVKESAVSYGQTSRMVRKALSKATTHEFPSEPPPP